MGVLENGEPLLDLVYGAHGLVPLMFAELI